MTGRLAILASLSLLLACRAPMLPPPPVAVEVPVPMPAESCPGGLVCEAPVPVDGWRVPQKCQPSRLGQRVQTCWLENQDWPRLVEFFKTRYPHGVENGPLLRISGQWQHPPHPGAPAPTPPLLLAHQRPLGVELVLLAGDPVDTAGSATDTGWANAGSQGRAP
jgi:hypothetical protein